MFKEKLTALGLPKPDTLCIIVLSVNKQLSINYQSIIELGGVEGNAPFANDVVGHQCSAVARVTHAP